MEKQMFEARPPAQQPEQTPAQTPEQIQKQALEKYLEQALEPPPKKHPLARRCLGLLAVFVGCALLAAFQVGMLTSYAWSPWRGYGDPSMEYTAAGQFFGNVLLGILPVLWVVWLAKTGIRCVKSVAAKNKRAVVAALLPLLAGTCGMGVAFFAHGLFVVKVLGMAFFSFLIETFHWLTYPIP
ncbi:MAG: hypothetical protein PHO10_04320 [Gemmiger sp.]|nr:hypothetical protein [Gemmiger sp.]